MCKLNYYIKLFAHRLACVGVNFCCCCCCADDTAQKLNAFTAFFQHATSHKHISPTLIYFYYSYRYIK